MRHNFSVEGTAQKLRFRVCVQSKTESGFIGLLNNDPYCTKELQSGALIAFGPEHFIQIYEQPNEPYLLSAEQAR